MPKNFDNLFAKIHDVIDGKVEPKIESDGKKRERDKEQPSRITNSLKTELPKKDYLREWEEKKQEREEKRNQKNN